MKGDPCINLPGLKAQLQSCLHGKQCSTDASLLGLIHLCHFCHQQVHSAWQHFKQDDDQHVFVVLNKQGHLTRRVEMESAGNWRILIVALVCSSLDVPFLRIETLGQLQQLLHKVIHYCHPPPE